MRKLEFSIDEYYHLYNRGVEQRVIFLDNADRYRFLKLIYLCNSHLPVDISEIPEGEAFRQEKGETLVDIGAFALMANHFHLLVKEKGVGGISKFMNKVCTGYTMYFNKRYKRKGVLFQGVFQATHMNTDPLLEYIYSYIHLNPVKIIEPEWKERGIKNPDEAVKFLDGYTFSSYLDYKDDRQRELSPILNKTAFPDYFSSKKEFNDILNSWLKFREQEENLTL
jgi:putative transposase